MRLTPRSIPGPLSSQNIGALDWGPTGLLAYGCQNNVSVVHVETLQLVQALSGHTSPVTQVKWCPYNPYHNLLVPVSLLFASADKSGRVLVWEVVGGKQVSELVETSRVAGQVMLSWLPNSFLLLVLLPPHNIVLWNAATGTKIWKQTILDPMNSISLDPFDPSKMVVVGDSCLLFFNDISTQKAPSGNPKKLYLTLKENPNRKSRIAENLLFVNDLINSRDGLQGLIKAVHSPYHRHHLYLLFSRDLVILDLELNHTIGSIVQDRGSSHFVDIVPCVTDDVIYCLHDSGAISVRRQDHEYKPIEGNNDSVYQCVGVSEPMRLSKNSKIVGLKIKPFTEGEALFLLTDGRLVGWKIFDHDGPIEFLSEVDWDCNDARMVMSSNYGSNSQPPYCVRVCPPLSTKNSHFYKPLLALGTQSGSVLIVDLTTTQTVKEYTLHTSPVCGIEWVANRRLLSFSNNIGPIKNELYYIDINTGRSLLLRSSHKDKDEVPITGIKVSYLHQYFIVLLKDRPFELWDLKSLSVIREMPGTFPSVSALEWSPAQNHSLKGAKFAKSKDEPLQILEPNKPEGPVREHFVFTDTEGIVYHLMVEGSVIKEGTRIPPDTQTGVINSIAWRGDLMVLGDSAGNISFWDLKSRQSRVVAANRGGIKKVALAPGRNTQLLLVLYNGGVDVWDSAEGEVFASLKSTSFGAIVDVDWGASDRPLLITEHGCIHIMDINLDSISSPISPHSLHTPIWLPFLHSQRDLMNFKIHLQHQEWREEWSLDFPDNISTSEKIWESMVETVKHRDKFHAFSLLERCLVTASMYGDTNEWLLWQVLAYYLDQSSPLPPSFDVLQDNKSYCNNQVARLEVQESCRKTYTHRQHCIHRHILLGHTDKPVQLLLEIEQDSPNFYLDSLKASLISSVSSSEYTTNPRDTMFLERTHPSTESVKELSTVATDNEVAQSTMKLVATNLIANDHLLEGCQLLCLIGKAMDACKYMQNFSHFNEAMWLAKVSLKEEEYSEVMRYYVEQLVTSGARHNAVMLAVSLQMYDRAADILLSSKLVTIAAPLVEAVEEAGKWPATPEGLAIRDATFVQYAQYLVGLDNLPAALFYCEKGGEKGATLGAELKLCQS